MASRKLTAEEAKHAILLILKEGDVEPTDHCRRRMRERGVTMPQLVHALKTGLVGAPKWSAEYEDWKYQIEGVDTEGDTLAAVTVIIEADLTLVIITVF